MVLSKPSTVTLLMLLACTSPSLSPSPRSRNPHLPPPGGGLNTDSIASITLTRTSVLGMGSDYLVTLTRDGSGTFNGGSRSLSPGYFVATVPAATQSAIWDRVARPGALTLLDPAWSCHGKPGLWIRIGFVDRSSATYGGGCDGPPENAATAAAIDSLLQGIRWRAPAP
jgi:hypothetical protein